MLQNRVDPFGDLILTPARGSWTGTRGILHNKEHQIIRPFKLKAWLTCQLQFKGRRRQVMAPDRYTSLFFLDEATSFAAGHRPCCECRREDFNRFKTAWLQGNPSYGFHQKTPIGEIDKILHRERIARDGSKVFGHADIHTLPDGAFIQIDKHAFLLKAGRIHRWTPSGYEASEAFPAEKMVRVLTPLSVLHAFRAGYAPQSAVIG